ncbi:hypothetical protein B0T24DRAFT_638643 [Lasiosphaeria ovina]|uniref:Uncharacterized protein n=1 Tax=Lasiosphaeria ovina TaxID=92902 RepID=A0AAE0N0E1_9PEZI|nr:hypothetical protein B0T24DRAFT_638643 [Lasiosphaeria ovina]
MSSSACFFLAAFLVMLAAFLAILATFLSSLADFLSSFTRFFSSDAMVARRRRSCFCRLRNDFCVCVIAALDFFLRRSAGTPSDSESAILPSE